MYRFNFQTPGARLSSLFQWAPTLVRSRIL